MAATAVSELPMLFNGQMVRAIDEGRKTNTRRIFTKQHGRRLGLDTVGSEFVTFDGPYWDGTFEGPIPWSPYGLPGDRLWVKETWRPFDRWDDDGVYEGEVIQYAADMSKREINDALVPAAWNRPKAAARGNVSPLFMPRWASRLTLEITGVRVERLQEISEGDAIAEGIQIQNGDGTGPGAGFKWDGPGYWGGSYYSRNGYKTYHVQGAFCCGCHVGMQSAAACAFRELWERINGAGSWSANPWVWVIEFKKVQA